MSDYLAMPMGSARNGKGDHYSASAFCLEGFNKAVAGATYDDGVVIPVPFENKGFQSKCLGSRGTRGEEQVTLTQGTMRMVYNSSPHLQE